MFILVGVNADRQLGILDTSDFVVEYHSPKTVKGFLAQGIKINGVVQDKTILNVQVQKGVLPKGLTDAINFYCNNHEDISYWDLTTELLSLQAKGLNVLKLWSASGKDVHILGYTLDSLVKEVTKGA